MPAEKRRESGGTLVVWQVLHGLRFLGRVCAIKPQRLDQADCRRGGNGPGKEPCTASCLPQRPALTRARDAAPRRRFERPLAPTLTWEDQSSGKIKRAHHSIQAGAASCRPLSSSKVIFFSSGFGRDDVSAYLSRRSRRERISDDERTFPLVASQKRVCHPRAARVG